MNSHLLRIIRSRLPQPLVHRLRRLLAADLCPPQRAATQVPLNTGYLDIALQCRKLLRDNLVAFYLPRSIDTAYGGYFETLRGDCFSEDPPKHLVLQCRQLWFFSTLAERGIEEQSASQAATQGFQFLLDNLHDNRYGGFYHSASREGRPIDRRKHVYAQSFAVFGLVSFYRATGSQDALACARTLFETLTAKAHDPIHGGALEWFSEDWVRLRDNATSSGVERRSCKTFNTHLHLLEAYSALYTVWPDHSLRDKVLELINIVTSRALAPSVSSSLQDFDCDWQPAGREKQLHASYGHDLEAVWLVLNALAALELAVDGYREWAEAVSRCCLRLSFDRRRGGFFNSGRLGKRADDRTKVWWVQAEALVGLLSMFRLSGDREYYDAFLKTFHFVERHQVAPQGGWWARVYEDGSRRSNTPRTGKWQGAYHSGRALLMCSDILEQLADQGSR